MNLNLNNLLLIVGVVLFVWAGLVAATIVTWGTFYVLVSFGLACFAASFLPAVQRRL